MAVCDECSFDWDLPPSADIAGLVVSGAKRLVGSAACIEAPARRRHPDRWSPLEYVCHVRDVLIVQRERLLLAQREERPSLQPMGRDERVLHDGYATQTIEDAAAEVVAAGRRLAHTMEQLDGVGWERTVMYNYPELRERTLRWVAINTLHELRHHTLDIESQRDGEW